MEIKQLIEGLNEVSFMAFPQKGDSKRVSLSILGEGGKRYFLNRAPIGGLDEQGKAQYGWALGNAMRAQKTEETKE